MQWWPLQHSPCKDFSNLPLLREVSWLCKGTTYTPLRCTFQCTFLTLCSVFRAYPASFAWFTPNMIAPGLGFLMFAVGINLTPESFTKVAPQVCDLTPACSLLLHLLHFSFTLSALQHIAIGTAAQWVIKPALGVLTASTLVPLLSLPSAIGAGLILVCRLCCMNMLPPKVKQ